MAGGGWLPGARRVLPGPPHGPLRGPERRALLARRPGRQGQLLRELLRRELLRRGSMRRHPMRRALILVAVVALAALGVRVVGFWPPGERPPSPAAQGSAGQAALPGVRTEGLHLVGRREGVRQWEADARRLVQPLEGKTLQFEQVENGVLYRDGKVFLRFEGEGGVYEETTGRLRLEGVFRLEHGALHRLTARNLVWEAARQELITREPLQVDSQELTLQAGAMTLDVRAGVAHLTGGVVAHQGEGSRLEATAADWHLETGEIILYGPAALEHRFSGANGPFRGSGDFGGSRHPEAGGDSGGRRGGELRSGAARQADARQAP